MKASCFGAPQGKSFVTVGDKRRAVDEPQEESVSAVGEQWGAQARTLGDRAERRIFRKKSIINFGTDRAAEPVACLMMLGRKVLGVFDSVLLMRATL